jgi:hypothetical protein
MLIAVDTGPQVSTNQQSASSMLKTMPKIAYMPPLNFLFDLQSRVAGIASKPKRKATLRYKLHLWRKGQTALLSAETKCKRTGKKREIKRRKKEQKITSNVTFAMRMEILLSATNPRTNPTIPRRPTVFRAMYSLHQGW